MKKLVITLLLLTIGYCINNLIERYENYRYMQELNKINQLEVLRCTMDNVDYCD